MDADKLNDRLLLVMDYLLRKDPIKFKTRTAVSKHIDYPQSNLSSALNGNERYLTEGLIKKFTDTFKELSYDWLRTGKGQMLRNMGNEDFISHLTEPDQKINPTLKDVQRDLKTKIKGKTYSEPASKIVEDKELVNATEIIVPFPGQAGLSSRMYPEELLQEFEKRTIRVRPEHRGVFYTIEADGNSMPPKIQPKDWLRCEEISSLFWFEKDFFKEKNIYCIWHNTKGILFKRIIYKDGEMWCRSDNEDKKEYADFPLEIEKVSKILIVRKLVDRSF